RGLVLLGLAAQVLGCRDRLARLAPELDDPLDDRTPKVGVRRTALATSWLAALRRDALARLALARRPGDGFGLAPLQRPGVEEPVFPILHLKSAPGRQCPDRPRNCQRIGQAGILPYVRRGAIKEIAGLNGRCGSGEEGVSGLQALIVQCAVPNRGRVEANPCTFCTRRSMGRPACPAPEAGLDPFVVLSSIDVPWRSAADLGQDALVPMPGDDAARALVPGRGLELWPHRAVEEHRVGGRSAVGGLDDVPAIAPPSGEDRIDRLHADLG